MVGLTETRAIPDEEIIFLYELHSPFHEVAHLPPDPRYTEVARVFVDKDNRSVHYDRDNRTGNDWVISKGLITLVKGKFENGQFKEDTDQTISIEDKVHVHDAGFPIPMPRVLPDVWTVKGKIPLQSIVYKAAYFNAEKEIKKF